MLTYSAAVPTVSENSNKNKMSQEMAVHVSMNTANWFTPKWITDIVRSVLGDITLDPASHRIPEQWIKARHTFRPDHPDMSRRDALKVAWTVDGEPSLIWLNSPFNKEKGKSNQMRWSKYLIAQEEAGNVLGAVSIVNAHFGYKWFDELAWDYPHCLLRDRVHFVSEGGSHKYPAKVAQALFYFGHGHLESFYQNFELYGRILGPVGRKWATPKYWYA